MDRFQLAFDAIRRIERFQSVIDRESERMQDSHQRHKAFVMQNGEDMPEIANWKWKPLDSLHLRDVARFAGWGGRPLRGRPPGRPPLCHVEAAHDH
jgi:hypothetical protein